MLSITQSGRHWLAVQVGQSLLVPKTVGLKPRLQFRLDVESLRVAVLLVVIHLLDCSPLDIRRLIRLHSLSESVVQCLIAHWTHRWTSRWMNRWTEGWTNSWTAAFCAVGEMRMCPQNQPGREQPECLGLRYTPEPLLTAIGSYLQN